MWRINKGQEVQFSSPDLTPNTTREIPGMWLQDDYMQKQPWNSIADGQQKPYGRQEYRGGEVQRHGRHSRGRIVSNSRKYYNTHMYTHAHNKLVNITGYK